MAGRLAKASGGIVAIVTAYRAAIAPDFKLPVPVFGPLEDPEALALMTRTLQVGTSACHFPKLKPAHSSPKQKATIVLRVLARPEIVPVSLCETTQTVIHYVEN